MLRGGSGGFGAWLGGRGLLGVGLLVGLLGVEGAEELEEGVVWVGHVCYKVWWVDVRSLRVG